MKLPCSLEYCGTTSYRRHANVGKKNGKSLKRKKSNKRKLQSLSICNQKLTACQVMAESRMTSELSIVAISRYLEIIKMNALQQKNHH